MTEFGCVVLHSGDAEWIRRVTAELDDLPVLSSSGGDELGQILTGDRDVAVLVVHLPDPVEGRRGWRRAALVHEQLPDLPIVAVVGEQVDGWSEEAGTSPATAVVRTPAPAAEVARAVRVAGRLPARSGPAGPGSTTTSRSSRSWAVIGVAGGVGTTTVATLLAAALARRDRTLLVDLDQRHGALAGTVRVTPRYTTFDLSTVFESPARLDEALPAVLTPVRDGLDLLAARDEPDVVVARAGTGDLSTVEALIRACTRTGHQVVVDLGDLPLASYPVLDEVGEAVVVCTQDIRVARRVPGALAQLRDRVPDVVVRTVVNRVQSGVEPGPRQLGSLVGRPFDATIPELAAVHHAQNQMEGAGLLDLASSPPRSVEVAVAALLDVSAPPGSGGGRRSRLGRRRHAELAGSTGGAS